MTCPVGPKLFKDTRTTFMSWINEDGSTSEMLIHDSWRCLDDASDGRHYQEWTGYTSFQVSKTFNKGHQSLREQASSMFSLAVIPKELKTGKSSVDVFDKVQIRNQPCKSDKRVRVETKSGRNGECGSFVELELCEEDQEDIAIGNVHIVLISADARKPRLVLVCSEESNRFTKLETAIGQYMTSVTITADDDLLSRYIWCEQGKGMPYRDENDAMFFAGPCTESHLGQD